MLTQLEIFETPQSAKKESARLTGHDLAEFLLTHDILYMTDPGHGWLRVPLALVKQSGAKISECSYADRNFAYLEEDCDMWAYVMTLPVDIKEWNLQCPQTHVDHESPVRFKRQYRG